MSPFKRYYSEAISNQMCPWTLANVMHHIALWLRIEISNLKSTPFDTIIKDGVFFRILRSVTCARALRVAQMGPG